MMSKYGCTVPWLPDPVVCSEAKGSANAHEVLRSYKMIMTNEILERCPLPCTGMKFTFGWPYFDTSRSKARILYITISMNTRKVSLFT